MVDPSAAYSLENSCLHLLVSSVIGDGRGQAASL